MKLLLRVQDKVNPNSDFENAKCLKRGEVVCAVPDSHVFSDREYNNPAWSVLSIPEMTDAEAGALCQREKVDKNENPWYHIRDFRIDMNKLKKELRDQIDNNNGEILITGSDLVEFRLAKEKKSKSVDPNAIIDRSREF